MQQRHGMRKATRAALARAAVQQVRVVSHQGEQMAALGATLIGMGTKAAEVGATLGRAREAGLALTASDAALCEEILCALGGALPHVGQQLQAAARQMQG